MRNPHSLQAGLTPSLLALTLALGACGNSAPPTDVPVDDAGDSGTTEDTAEVDTTPPGPPACKDVPLAVDPPSSLDPLADGPYKTGRTTLVVPKLGILTDVKVRVWYPAEADGTTPHAGRHAWVMFHHAVHYPTTIFDRYNGTFDRWATHGFVVYSIDGHKLYFPTPAGTNPTYKQQVDVAGLMDEAITYFLAQQEELDFPLRCIADKDRGSVSGHSRGGGAALLVPVDRTDGAQIKAYVGFQPMNPEATIGAPKPGTAVLPLYDRPCLWFDSANDGDVIFPITAMLFERTHAPASHVAILGSKHTYTLDIPFPDQGGEDATITPVEHKNVQHYYGLPFLRARVRDKTPAPADLARFLGSGGMGVPTSVSSGDTTLRWHIPLTEPHVAKLDVAAGKPATTTEASTPLVFEGGMTATGFETYATSTVDLGSDYTSVSKLISSVVLRWADTDGAAEFPLPTGALTGKTALVFETANLGSTSATSGTHPLFLEITDTAGGKAQVAIDSLVGSGWGKRPRRLSMAYLTLTKLTGVDLARAKSIRFVVKAGTAKADVLIHRLRAE